MTAAFSATGVATAARSGVPAAGPRPTDVSYPAAVYARSTSPEVKPVIARPSPLNTPRVGAPLKPGLVHASRLQALHASDIWSEPAVDRMPLAAPPQPASGSSVPNPSSVVQNSR